MKRDFQMLDSWLQDGRAYGRLGLTGGLGGGPVGGQVRTATKG